jgi:hypothetical protein
MENRHGLVVGGGASLATGTAEREEALALVVGRRGRRRITRGADKTYDVADFVASLRSRSVSPHIAIDGHLSKTDKPHKTAVDARVTRHIGYAISQRCRKRIEEVFGWIKASAGLPRSSCEDEPGWTLSSPSAWHLQLDPTPKLLAAA